VGNFLFSLLLPPLLAFGLYHLLTWFDLLHINRMLFWKRVALASAITHVALATGFFLYLYADYSSHDALEKAAPSFGVFLFERSEFRWVLTVFDTAAIAALLAFFFVLDRLGASATGLVFWTVAITYVAGSIQWYFIGGAAGALLEKLWSGLKTGDDDEWFQ
jgi:hypothetical protein